MCIRWAILNGRAVAAWRSTVGRTPDGGTKTGAGGGVIRTPEGGGDNANDGGEHQPKPNATQDTPPFISGSFRWNRQSPCLSTSSKHRNKGPGSAIANGPGVSFSRIVNDRRVWPITRQFRHNLSPCNAVHVLGLTEPCGPAPATRTTGPVKIYLEPQAFWVRPIFSARPPCILRSLRYAIHSAAAIALLKKSIFNLSVDPMEPSLSPLGSFLISGDLRFQLRNPIFGRAQLMREALRRLQRVSAVFFRNTGRSWSICRIAGLLCRVDRRRQVSRFFQPARMGSHPTRSCHPQ